MYKTKLTQKGQITIPSLYREKLHLSRGSVLIVEMIKSKIMIEKPKENIDRLFGAWKDLSDKDLEEIKSIWAGWNEKDIGKL
jgi:AbrB family looped-hinge helix DNA binding protein